MNLLKLEMFKHVLETLTMELSAKVVQCSIINIFICVYVKLELLYNKYCVYVTIVLNWYYYLFS